MDLDIVLTNIRICNLLRYILMRNPFFAEESYEMGDFVQDFIEKGFRVFFNDKEKVYIVVDNATKFTTNTLPEKYINEQIISIPERNSRSLKAKLEVEISKLYTDAEHPKILNFQRILEDVNACYSDYQKQSNLNIRLISFLSQTALKNIKYSDEEIAEWALKWTQNIFHKFMRFEFCGDELIELLSTFQFIYFSPNPSYVYELGILFAKSVTKNLNQVSNIDLFPMVQIDFYLNNANIPVNHRVIGFKGVVRFFHKQATVLRKGAQQERTFQLFYRNLYQAGLYYRAAQLVLHKLLDCKNTEVQAFLKNMDLNELKRINRNCDEIQTMIHVSFGDCIDDDRKVSINFTDPLKLNRWLTKLADNPFEDIEKEIRERSMTLMFPDFIRDYLLGLLYCQNINTIDEGILKLKSFVQKVEENLFLCTSMGDPNFLSDAYKTLSIACNKIGMLNEAKDYAQKSTGEYMKSRIAREFEKQKN